MDVGLWQSDIEIYEHFFVAMQSLICDLFRNMSLKENPACTPKVNTHCLCRQCRNFWRCRRGRFWWMRSTVVSATPLSDRCTETWAPLFGSWCWWSRTPLCSGCLPLPSSLPESGVTDCTQTFRPNGANVQQQRSEWVRLILGTMKWTKLKVKLLSQQWPTTQCVPQKASSRIGVAQDHYRDILWRNSIWYWRWMNRYL